MSFELFSNILSQPWAIDPQYVEGISPLLAALLDQRPVAWQKVSGETPYAIGARSTSPTGMASASPGSIAVIPLSGPLMKNDQFCGPVGTARIGQWMREADANDKIEGIILKVDSPGGTVDGTEDLARIVKNTKKPVVAYIDGLAASAAYWIASSADEVMASGKTTLVGSIGTMSKIADFQPMLEKAGIKFHEVYATKSADKNKEYRDAVRDGNYAGMINNFLDPLNALFHSTVRTNRRDKLSSEENIFSGKTYFSTEAKKHGLIDAIGSMEDAIKSIRSLANTKNKISMSTLNTYQPFTSFPDEQQVARIEQLQAQGNPAPLSLRSQQAASETTQPAVVSERQDNRKWQDASGRYTTARAVSTPAPDTTEEDSKRRQDRSRWQDKTGKYSTSALQTKNSSAENVPSYKDPNNPFNRVADKNNKGQA